MFPTICSLAKVKVDEELLDGRNVTGILTGTDKSKPSRELLWHTGSPAELKRGVWTALRQGDWKFLETSKGEQFLFNLAQDPYEKTNLKTQRPKLFNELRKRRDALLEECLPRY